MIAAGPYAAKVTQHIASDGTADRYGDAATTWVDKPRTAFAEFPGNSLETDTPAGDTTLADLVLLVDPAFAASSRDEWTASDGLRYRTQGHPDSYRHPGTGTAVTQVNLRRIT